MLKTTLWIFFILCVLSGVYALIVALRSVGILILLLFAGWLLWQCLKAVESKKEGEP